MPPTRRSSSCRTPGLDTKQRKLLFHIGQSSNLPRQEVQLGVLGRFFQIQCGEHVGLLGVNGGDAADRGGGIDSDAVVLNSAQLCQRFLVTPSRA